MTLTMDSQQAYKHVLEGYSAAALASSSTTAYADRVAKAFGYSPAELADIPAGANMGLSCGNPTALAGIKEGETILDLGSGGGFDIFLAAKQLGKTGRAIGIDMNADMIALANRNAQKSPHAPQIEFLHSKITSIPAVPSGSVDCVISNCVINLVPDSEKPDVFRECARLLKPGGRVAVSDILAKKELPDSIRNDAGMLVGCIAGASRVYEYEGWLRESGFADVVVVDTGKDINVYKDAKEGCCGAVPDKKESTTTGGGCCAPKKTKTETAEGEKKEVEVDYDLNEWVGSYQIYAIKAGKTV